MKNINELVWNELHDSVWVQMMYLTLRLTDIFVQYIYIKDESLLHKQQQHIGIIMESTLSKLLTNIIQLLLICCNFIYWKNELCFQMIDYIISKKFRCDKLSDKIAKEVKEYSVKYGLKTEKL